MKQNNFLTWLSRRPHFRLQTCSPTQASTSSFSISCLLPSPLARLKDRFMGYMHFHTFEINQLLELLTSCLLKGPLHNNTTMPLFPNTPCLSRQGKAVSLCSHSGHCLWGFLHSCFLPCPLSSSSLSYRSIPTCALQKLNTQQVPEKGLCSSSRPALESCSKLCSVPLKMAQGMSPAG